jgi:aminomethyltransferase
MPIQSPFHERTAKFCESNRWKQWAGYYAVCSYDTSHDREYYAIRHSVAMIDVTPLFKYEVKGKDAGRFLARVMAKDVSKLKQNQVTYCCWCDEDGKVLDDGTVTKFEEDYYRVTAAEASYQWFMSLTRGYDVTIEDISESWAALSTQGPLTRDLLKRVVDVDMDALGYFRAAHTTFKGKPLVITRTGYTGDLGYELWVPNESAIALYDAVYNEGRNFGAEPCGLDAMDVSRIEAGYIMNGVDYYSANRVMIDARKSTPLEISLGWTVQTNRAPFLGQKALMAEEKAGAKKGIITLDIDWNETEALYGSFGLPPEISSAAWRSPVPVYNEGGDFIGKASSGAFSPTLKKNLAFAQLDSAYLKPGTKVKFEMTVEYRRHKVTATVCQGPMYDPERKRSTPKKAVKAGSVSKSASLEKGAIHA